MISFFVRLPYISINYMEARTQLCISQNIFLYIQKYYKFFMKYRAGEVPVFEIDNSKRNVDNIINNLTNIFEKRF